MRGRWTRSEGVLWRKVAGGVMVLAPDSEEPFVLAGSGAVVWQLLERAIGMDEASVALAAAFGITADVAEAHIEPFMVELTERGAAKSVA
jgi:hypothetical protein